MKKTILVTGASRGIGKAIAIEFAKHRYNVVINCNKDIENLYKLEKELIKINPNILAIPCDLSNFKKVEEMVNEIERKFENVDILINNAGISHIGLFNLISLDEIHNIINTNLMSTIYCSRKVIEKMIQKKSGSIINITSIWGEVGASCEVMYSSSKAGIDGFTKALAKEVAPSGIRVNSISCGVINTDMNNCLTKEEKYDIIKEIPMNRFGEAKEIADTCLFLASDKSSYITGQIVRIDGGFL